MNPAGPSWRMNRVVIDGHLLCYWEAGAGEPLLLLHGYPQSHHCWRHQAQALALHYRVLVPDWFGWGMSVTHASLRPDYDEEVGRLYRLIQALQLPACNLAGHDYGGYLALGFALRYPHTLKRLAILNSRAHRSFTDTTFYWQTALQCFSARVPGLRSLFERLPLYAMHRRVMDEYVPAAFTAEELDGYIGWLKTRQGRQRFVRFFRHYQVRRRPSLSVRLERLTLPVALIWGGQDPYCGSTIATDLVRRLPRATLYLIPDAGHFVMEQAPGKVLDAMWQWLRGE